MLKADLRAAVNAAGRLGQHQCRRLQHRFCRSRSAASHRRIEWPACLEACELPHEENWCFGWQQTTPSALGRLKQSFRLRAIMRHWMLVTIIRLRTIDASTEETGYFEDVISDQLFWWRADH